MAASQSTRVTGPAAPTDDGGARHLVRGLAIPDIALPLTTGASTSLARRPGWVVVYAYPWTGRPGLPDPPGWDVIAGAHGSTPQGEAFRNLHPAFVELGVELYGLSLQDSEWQREFAARLDLPFALVSDSQRLLQRALRLPVFETGGSTYLKRLTLVLRDGHIERTYYPVYPPHTHPRELLAWIDERVTRR
jgi:peroxiredoxin